MKKEELCNECLQNEPSFIREQSLAFAQGFSAAFHLQEQRFGKMIEFTTHISTLEKGCAPSVGLMDTRIDMAKKAIEQLNNAK